MRTIAIADGDVRPHSHVFLICEGRWGEKSHVHEGRLRRTWNGFKVGSRYATAEQLAENAYSRRKAAEITLKLMKKEEPEDSIDAFSRLMRNSVYGSMGIPSQYLYGGVARGSGKTYTAQALKDIQSSLKSSFSMSSLDAMFAESTKRLAEKIDSEMMRAISDTINPYTGRNVTVSARLSRYPILGADYDGDIMSLYPSMLLDKSKKLVAGLDMRKIIVDKIDDVVDAFINRPKFLRLFERLPITPQYKRMELASELMPDRFIACEHRILKARQKLLDHLGDKKKEEYEWLN
jgi:hypothetical protein